MSVKIFLLVSIISYVVNEDKLITDATVSAWFN